MIPYKDSSDQIKKQQEAPGKLLKSAASVAVPSIIGGAGVMAGKEIGKRILPLLSEFVPEDLAVKGISKVNPTLGKFIKTAVNQGNPFENVKDFIKNKFNSQESNKAPDQRSIIEQYSPELFQFLTGEIQNGRQPLEAGALAQNLGKFSKEIKKMEKDHKTPFSSIIESIFGSAQQPQQNMQQGMQQQMQGQPQQSGGDEELLNEMAKVLKM